MVKPCNQLPDGRVDILAEISRAFDGTSPAASGPLTWVLFTGGVGAGKTTIRREKYDGSGYVTLDAGEIFIRLCRGRYVNFPPPPEEKELAEALDLIGCGIALRAVGERRNIVTELIGATVDPMKTLIDAITSIGYHCELASVYCDVAQAWERNLSRSDDNISAFYTEPFHHRWILNAIQACSAAAPSAEPDVGSKA